MKAMIFAAGLGTRLYPLTKNKPKALVELNGKPLLQIQIEKLITFGFKEIVVNVHHFADLVTAFIEDNKFEADVIISDESEKLLDTGGAIKKASRFWKLDEMVLIHNVDIISSLDVTKLIYEYKTKKCLSVLAVKKRKSSRYLLFDKHKTLVGWENTKTGEKIISRNTNEINKFAFSGIHVINTKIQEYFPTQEKFSIIDIYLKASKTEKILAYQHDDSSWIDVGTPEKLKEATKL